jgi:O-antigen ligase
LAAIGFVLCARMRGGAVAACVPLGLAAYLTVSRGALAALLGGVIALTFLAPTWGQLRATAIGLGGALVAALAASRMDAFSSLQGSSGDAQGLAMLAITLILMGIAFMLDRGPRNPKPLPLPRRAPLIGFGAILAILALLFAAAYKDRRQVTRTPAAGTAPARLTSIESNRYAYWEVAVREFGRHPFKGIGTGGFRVAWLRERKITESAQDAHSLYIETACELGVIGLALLALLYGGVAARARRLYALDPALAAGPIAALTVFALHAGVDWDWEMPAVTLVALVLAAAVLGASETPAPRSESPQPAGTA